MSKAPQQLGNVVALTLQRMNSPERAASLPMLRRSPADVPALVDEETDVRIPERYWSAFVPAVGGRALRVALTAEDRAKLAARLSTLQVALEPFSDAERDDVKFAISLMLGGFRTLRNQSADDVSETVRGTARALRRFPNWAIVEGCDRIGNNRSDLDKRYAPHDPEIASVVDEVVRPYRARLKSVENLLAAPVEPEPARETRPNRQAYPRSTRRAPPIEEMLRVMSAALPRIVAKYGE